ncbi:hypothetical protein BS78_01G146100 [Paspalum vaginatum]|nr:hypothetical protein BS78_01G146100 [Paspalum vaginatum]
MEGVSAFRFGHQDLALNPGGGMIPSGMGSLLQVGVGVPAPGGMMNLPGGGLAPSAGFGAMRNALHAAWNAAPVARRQLQQQLRAAGGGVHREAPAQPFRGPWTEQEDATLREMVERHGEKKWAVVAQSLPGRIGKQCRERYTNHLRPGIMKSLWTEEDDRELIRLHQKHGNRWSVIAKGLSGRSENAVKNHWNATKRSLKAKRRLKKKKNAEQVPAGEWSVLEEYIRNLGPDPKLKGAAPALLAPDSPPSSYNSLGYGEVVTPPPPAGAFDPTTAMGMGLYLNAGGGSSSSSAAAATVNLGAMMSSNFASFLQLDLNAYYGGAPRMQLMAEPQQMMEMEIEQEQQAAASYANLVTYPFLDTNLMWQIPMVANATEEGGALNYHYGEEAAGGSGGAPDDVDVVQMASREFLTPSEHEVTLNLAGFM